MNGYVQDQAIDISMQHAAIPSLSNRGYGTISLKHERSVYIKYEWLASIFVH